MTVNELKAISNLTIIKEVLGSADNFFRLFDSQINCSQFSNDLIIDKSHCLETFELIRSFIYNFQKTNHFEFSMKPDYIALFGIFHHIFQNPENQHLKNRGFILWKFLFAYQKFTEFLFENIFNEKNYNYLEDLFSKLLSEMKLTDETRKEYEIYVSEYIKDFRNKFLFTDILDEKNFNYLINQLSILFLRLNLTIENNKPYKYAKDYIEKLRSSPRLINNQIELILINTFSIERNKRSDYVKLFKENADYKFAFKTPNRRNRIETNDLIQFEELEELKSIFYILLFFDIYSGFTFFTKKNFLTTNENETIKQIAFFILVILLKAIGTYRFSNYSNELKDYAFQVFDNNNYNKAQKALFENLPSHKWRKQVFKKLQEITKQLFPKNIKIEILQREKSVYSAFLKSLTYETQVADLWDLYAFRLIIETDDKEDCYILLYEIEKQFSKWSDPKGEADYIKNPKDNGYQSLHIIITDDEHLVSKKNLIEIQIRTAKMNFIAEFGEASHQIYKEKVKLPSDFNLAANQGKRILKEVLRKNGLSLNDFINHLDTNLKFTRLEWYYAGFANDKYALNKLIETLLEEKRKINER